MQDNDFESVNFPIVTEKVKIDGLSALLTPELKKKLGLENDPFDLSNEPEKEEKREEEELKLNEEPQGSSGDTNTTAESGSKEENKDGEIDETCIKESPEFKKQREQETDK